MSRSKLPSMQSLDDRLDAQRERLFNATAVVGLAQTAAHHGNPIDGSLDQNLRTDIWCALRLAVKELEAVAESLEPGVILEVEPTAKEIAARAIAHMQQEGKS